MERKMRLLKCTTKYEENPWKRGEFKKILGSQTVVWDGEVDETELNPDGRWFWEQTFDLPRNSEENRGERRLGRPQDGEEDFSYVLQEEKDGRWVYVAHITPWIPAEGSCYDDSDWGDRTDPEALKNLRTFQDAMEIAQA